MPERPYGLGSHTDHNTDPAHAEQPSELRSHTDHNTDPAHSEGPRGLPGHGHDTDPAHAEGPRGLPSHGHDTCPAYARTAIRALEPHRPRHRPGTRQTAIRAPRPPAATPAAEAAEQQPSGRTVKRAGEFDMRIDSGRHLEYTQPMETFPTSWCIDRRACGHFPMIPKTSRRPGSHKSSGS
ncbi:hypothetical protein GCM10010399_71030 [Dactylosporangium fulvum]